jgi:hypothetical protein
MVKCREEGKKDQIELPNLEPGHMHFNPSHTDDTTPTHHESNQVQLRLLPSSHQQVKATLWEKEQIARGPLRSTSGSGKGEQLLGF